MTHFSDIFEEIVKAVETLGYKNAREIVSVKNHGLDRYIVKINFEYYGIWDAIKKTFVD